MRTIAFLTIFAVLASSTLHAQTTHKITQSGFTYSPAELTVNVGDEVEFEGTSNHPIQEVSEVTWNDNGITPLEGGFAFQTGSGKVTFQNAGTHFYVCVAHVASQGMKGKIIVQGPAALSEASSSDELAVFPLPLTGNDLTIALKSADQQHFTVNLYDLTGNLVGSSVGSSTDGRYVMDCSALPKGVYLLKLKTDTFSASGKIIRE
jgi:plastocyanin